MWSLLPVIFCFPIYVLSLSNLQGPHSDFAGPTAGCTACVAIIQNNKLVVANAGDSRCVLSRKGQVIFYHSISLDTFTAIYSFLLCYLSTIMFSNIMIV